ncbi:MAG: hypothetical protein DYG92_00510 [Leptolyngbya sp. PLA1]|nr:hypothetical protein [Leptolyngbya sp. PLA1]
MHSMVLTLMATFALALIPDALGQTPIRPPGARWVITPPPGWKLAPQSVVDSMNLERDSEDPDREDFRYVLKFDPEGSLGVGLPYIAVEWTDVPEFATCNWSDIGDYWGSESFDPAWASLPLSRLVEKIPDQASLLDESKGRLYHRWDEPGGAPNGKTLRAVGVVVLTSNGFAEVCLYDKAEENNRHVAALEKFANTLALDSGAAFVPGPGLPRNAPPSHRTNSSFRFPFRFGIFGLGGLGGVTLLVLIVRKVLQAD